MKNCILMMMMWKDLQKFIKNGCNRNSKLFTPKKVCLVYEAGFPQKSNNEFP